MAEYEFTYEYPCRHSGDKNDAGRPWILRAWELFEAESEEEATKIVRDFIAAGNARAQVRLGPEASYKPQKLVKIVKMWP